MKLILSTQAVSYPASFNQNSSSMTLPLQTTDTDLGLKEPSYATTYETQNTL